MRAPLFFGACFASTIVALATVCCEGPSAPPCPTGYVYDNESAVWPSVGYGGIWYEPYDYWDVWPGPYDWSYWDYPYPYDEFDPPAPALDAGPSAGAPSDGGYADVAPTDAAPGATPSADAGLIGPGCWECAVICTTNDRQRQAARAVSDVSYDDACRMATNAIIAWAGQNLGQQLKVCIRPGQVLHVPSDAATAVVDGAVVDGAAVGDGGSDGWGATDAGLPARTDASDASADATAIPR